MKVGRLGPRERAATLDALAKVMFDGFEVSDHLDSRGVLVAGGMSPAGKWTLRLIGGSRSPAARLYLSWRQVSGQVAAINARGMTVEALAVAIRDALVAGAERAEAR